MLDDAGRRPGREPVEVRTLPPMFAELPVAADVLRDALSTPGGYAVEVFAGSAVLTLGLLAVGVPCLQPWDVVFGPNFDVWENGYILEELITKGLVTMVHLGPPCKSFSFGRFPALRDGANPHGLPNLGTAEMELVDTGNELALWSAKVRKLCYGRGVLFTLENPQ